MSSLESKKSTEQGGMDCWCFLNPATVRMPRNVLYQWAVQFLIEGDEDHHLLCKQAKHRTSYSLNEKTKRVVHDELQGEK